MIETPTPGYDLVNAEVSWYLPVGDGAADLEFYLQGRLHLDDLISRKIKLEDVNEGLAALETGEVAEHRQGALPPPGSGIDLAEGEPHRVTREAVVGGRPDGPAVPLLDIFPLAREWGYDGIEVEGKRPHGFALDRQPASLIVVEAKATRAELLSKDTVLLEGVFDGFLLVTDDTDFHGQARTFVD